MLAPMPGPLLGAVVLNLGSAGVADPAQRLERVYEWRIAQATGWLRMSAVALAATLAPLAIDIATDGDSLDGTGRFFLVVAAAVWGGLIVGMSVRLQRLEREYSTAQALLGAVRAAPAQARPPGPPPPRPAAAPSEPPGLPPAAG